MADFSSMGALLTIVLLTINGGLFVLHISDNNEPPLIPTHTGTEITEAYGSDYFSVFPSGLDLNSSDANQIDPSGLQSVVMDQNVVVTSSANPIESFVGGITMLWNAFVLALKLVLWLLFAWILTLTAVPGMPIQIVLISSLVILPIQIYFIVSFVGSVLGVVRK